MSKMFMSAAEIMEVLGVSQSYAYGLIRQLNAELKAKGYYTITGRVDRKFFFEHFYQTSGTMEANAHASV